MDGKAVNEAVHIHTEARLKCWACLMVAHLREENRKSLV